MSPSTRARWGLPRPAVGLALSGPATPAHWRAMRGWARRAESLELHSLWLPEMHFAPGSTPAPLVDLAGLAACTERLRLGTTSLLLPIHDPLEVARAAAALDHLSRGRLILGLGRGFRAPLFRAFGIEPRSKRDRFDEALARMRAHWSEPDGWPPYRAPAPALAVAAFGPKGLAQAARHRLPYLASPMEPLAQLVDNWRAYRAALPADAAGDDIVVPVMRTVHAAASDADARRVREGLARETAAAPSRRLPRALERAAAAAPEERAVVGTVPEVRDRLAELRERLALDLLVVRSQVPGATPDEQQRSLGRLQEIAADWR